MRPIDLAVEKVVLHHKLAKAEQLKKAWVLYKKNPAYTYAQILVKTKIIAESQVEKILAQAEKLVAQEAAAKARGNRELTVAETVETMDVSQMNLLQLLELATEKNASDLHIHVDFPPVIRVNGDLISMGQHRYTPQETENLLFSPLDEKQTEALKKDLSLDSCIEKKGVGRFRTCITRQRLGWDGSFHIIKSGIPTFKDLGLPEHLKRLTEYPQGLVLVAGPSGSGKSSTLAAMIEHINVTRNEHIITLEDPVEFLFEPKESHISQRQVGDNTKSYSNALRGALREDPDIIMLGELRDVETASLAISASETGHLVFTTLHTTSAAKTVNRVLDIFPPVEQLQIRSMISQSLRGIVCQKLIPRLNGNGRVLAQEIMFNIPAVGNLINKNQMLQLPSIMQTKAKMGMQLMDASLQQMVRDEIISEDEAYYAAENTKLFQKPEIA